jgi:hypothetical protein
MIILLRVKCKWRHVVGGCRESTVTENVGPVISRRCHLVVHLLEPIFKILNLVNSRVARGSRVHAERKLDNAVRAHQSQRSQSVSVVAIVKNTLPKRRGSDKDSNWINTYLRS